MSTPPHVVGFRQFSGVGVEWQRRCKIRLALRELHNQSTAVASCCVVLAVTEMSIELHHGRRGNPRRDTRWLLWRKCAYGKPPARQLHGIRLRSGSDNITRQTIFLEMSSVRKKVQARCRSPVENMLKFIRNPLLMQFAEYLTELQGW